MFSDRRLCMIPDDIELDKDVLKSLIMPATAHDDPNLIALFGETIGMLRQIIKSDTAQPFILSGSNALGWDMISNLIEKGDQVLIISNGYFGSQIAECLEIYGAKVTHLCAEIGLRVSQEAIKEAVSKTNYKFVTVTLVETSTGVLSDIKAVSKTVKSISPTTLVIVDSMCSIASEEIQFDAWDLDMVILGSQKDLGFPYGLSIVIASQRAIHVSQTRKLPTASYYTNWNKWLPVMQAYEVGQASYLETSAFQLMHALHGLLVTMLDSPLEARFKKQRQVASEFRQTVKSWGLELVAQNDMYAANGITTIWLPEGIDAAQLIESVSNKGAHITAGLLKSSTAYFGISHIGISATEDERQHVVLVKNALFFSLNELGYDFKVTLNNPNSRL